MELKLGETDNAALRGDPRIERVPQNSTTSSSDKEAREMRLKQRCTGDPPTSVQKFNHFVRGSDEKGLFVEGVPVSVKY